MKPRMNSPKGWSGTLSLGYASFLGISLLTQTIGGEARDLIYETGFEETEGYSMEKDLIGQSGWIGYVSGGDFLETNHNNNY